MELLLCILVKEYGLTLEQLNQMSHTQIGILSDQLSNIYKLKNGENLDPGISVEGKTPDELRAEMASLSSFAKKKNKKKKIKG